MGRTAAIICGDPRHKVREDIFRIEVPGALFNREALQSFLDRLDEFDELILITHQDCHVMREEKGLPVTGILTGQQRVNLSQHVDAKRNETAKKILDIPAIRDALHSEKLIFSMAHYMVEERELRLFLGTCDMLLKQARLPIPKRE